MEFPEKWKWRAKNNNVDDDVGDCCSKEFWKVIQTMPGNFFVPTFLNGGATERRENIQSNEPSNY